VLAYKSTPKAHWPVLLTGPLLTPRMGPTLIVLTRHDVASTRVHCGHWLQSDIVRIIGGPNSQRLHLPIKAFLLPTNPARQLTQVKTRTYPWFLAMWFLQHLDRFHNENEHCAATTNSTCGDV
jgi:hypothetical protein